MENVHNTSDRICVQRLLRCRRTQRYFSGTGWTPDLALAKSFPSQFEAIRACIEHRIVDVDLVLRAPGAGVDLFSTAVR